MKRYLTPHAGLDREFDILFVDTEFTRLPWPKEAVWSWAEHCQVLSVGIVPLAADGELDEFYAAREIGDAVLAQCTPFVRGAVIPHLGAAAPTMSFEKNVDLGRGVADFLAGRQQLTGRKPLLAVDWIGDAYLLAPLLEEEPDWLLIEGIAQIKSALSEGLAGRVRHNALHDAQAIREGFVAFLKAQRYGS